MSLGAILLCGFFLPFFAALEPQNAKKTQLRFLAVAIFLGGTVHFKYVRYAYSRHVYFEMYLARILQCCIDVCVDSCNITSMVLCQFLIITYRLFDRSCLFELLGSTSTSCNWRFWNCKEKVSGGKLRTFLRFLIYTRWYD